MRSLTPDDVAGALRDTGDEVALKAHLEVFDS